MVCEESYTDGDPIRSKFVAFNEEFYVTINILKQGLNCKYDHPVRTKDEIIKSHMKVKIDIMKH